MNPLWIIAGIIAWIGASALIVAFIHACEATNGDDW